MKINVLFLILFCILFFIVSCDEKIKIYPYLTDISPATRAINMPGFTLTLNGQNFAQGATVNFGGSVKNTEFISSSQLKCKIDATDIQALSLDYVIVVYVTNPSPEGGNSNSIYFKVTLNHSFMAFANLSNDKYDSSIAGIGVDSKNNINVVWGNSFGTTGEIMYKKSTNHGFSWTQQTNISNSNAFCFDPAIAIGQDGDINVVWTEYIEYKDCIYFSRSTDNGVTWSTPLRIWESYDGASNPAIAVDSEGNIDLVWISRTGDSYKYGYCLYFTRSIDRGESFSTSLKIENDFTSNDPDIAVDSSGRIFIAYSQGKTLYINYVVYIQSEDNGATWSIPKKISTGDTLAMYPDIAIDTDGNINLAWNQEVSDFWNVFYTRSTDHGTTWKDPVNVSKDDITSMAPSITVDSLGNINLTWIEGEFAAEKVYYCRSINDGITWTTDIKIPNNTDYTVWLDSAVDGNCNLYIVSIDHILRNPAEIYFTKSVTAP